jgi:hypothetical protein
MGSWTKALPKKPGLEKKDNDWAEPVPKLVMVATRYPQAIYVGLQKSMQQEWQFWQ